jgi:hypothetical protein
MFLSSLQPSATYATHHDHGISLEKAAIESELSYLEGFDPKNVSVEIFGDSVILSGVVSTSSELARVLRIARSVVGYDRLLSRLVVCRAI